MPFVPPLPLLVLPLMSRQMAVFSPAVLLPESTRMPGRTPPRGAATLLFAIVTLTMPDDALFVARMPLPWVLLIVLLETLTDSEGVAAVLPLPSAPTAMPGWPFTFECESMWLLLMTHFAVTVPNALHAMATPAMFASGLIAVPLFSMSKLPSPCAVTDTLTAWVPMRFAELAPAMRLPVIVMMSVTLKGSPVCPRGPPFGLSD